MMATIPDREAIREFGRNVVRKCRTPKDAKDVVKFLRESGHHDFADAVRRACYDRKRAADEERERRKEEG